MKYFLLTLITITLFVYSNAQISPINATITTTVTFSNVVPFADFSSICYSGWQCQNDPGVSTTWSATNPRCSCPYTTVSSDPKPYNPENDETIGYKSQLRWGFSTSTAQSGFGFRGVTNYPVPSPGSLMILGTCAHFNYVITGGQVRSWNMNMLVNLNIAGTVQTTTFTANLELDETLNTCDKKNGQDGCNTNPYWIQFPNSQIWPECNICPCSNCNSFNRRFSACDSVRCCPYRSLSGTACSDRIFTLTEFNSQSPPFIINGLKYTIFFNGFADPSSTGTNIIPKNFFISDETQRTEAVLYGRLVVSCPDTSCPNGNQNFELNADKTACTCVCPPSLSGACPIAGQVRNSNCQCVCNNNCNICGTPVLTNNVCGCSFNNSCCPGNLIANIQGCQCPVITLRPFESVFNNGTHCYPICDSTLCPNGTFITANSVPGSCACSCPVQNCPNNQIVDESCSCSCPQNFINNCVSPLILDPIACTCVCNPVTGCNGTFCPCIGGDECYLESCILDENGNVNGTCGITFYENKTCGQTQNLCLQRCLNNKRECQNVPITCNQQDLVMKYGTIDSQCFDYSCDPSSGNCLEHFNFGQVCNVSGLNNFTNFNSDFVNQCYTGVCMNYSCMPVFQNNECNPGYVNNNSCYESVAYCAIDGCYYKDRRNESCQDGNSCTYNRIFDPTGSKSDQCLFDNQSQSYVCIGNYDVCADDIEQQISLYSPQEQKRIRKLIDQGNCPIQCLSDLFGRYCLIPCAGVTSKSSSDRAAIIGGVIGGTCAFFIVGILLVFGYVKFGHQRLVNLLNNLDFGNSHMNDSPLYQESGQQKENVTYSP